MEIGTLVRMGHEIARNNAALPHAQAVARVAGHLKSFWTPVMIADIQAFADAQPAALDPLLVDALGALRGD